MPQATKISRKLHKLTYATQALEQMARLWGISTDNHQSDFDKAIENQILYDEHTFGIAMTHGGQQTWKYGEDFEIAKSLGHYDYAETSWQEKGNRIEQAERIIEPIKRNTLSQIAEQLPIEGKKVLGSFLADLVTIM